MRKVTKAVIPAAGLGTRFLPATKAQPKEMLPVVDKPAIQYVDEEAVAAGIDDNLIITGRNKRTLEDHFDRNFELEYQLASKGKQSDLAEVVEQELRDSVPYLHVVTHVEPLEDPRSFADTGLDAVATPPSARPLPQGEAVPPLHRSGGPDEKGPTP